MESEDGRWNAKSRYLWDCFKDLFKDIDVLDVDAKTRTATSSAKVRRQYLTIILRGHTGYEMIYNQRGA